MENVIPGLYTSTPEPLGFGPSLEIRAFLLQRERGNLLVYRSEMLERDAEEINAVGGISGQYLNHRHEASPACDWVANTFGAPLYVHEEEAPSASETCNVAATFSERHRLDDDLEVIPTPGHTSEWGYRLPLGHGASSLPVHGRYDLLPPGRMGSGGAGRCQRSGALHRESGGDPHS